MEKEKVLLYLKAYCFGRKNTQKSRRIETALRMSGTELRKQIHRLRKCGAPIGSDRNGYFYAATAGEVYSTIRQLEQMKNGITTAISGLEQSLVDFERSEN